MSTKKDDKGTTTQDATEDVKLFADTNVSMKTGRLTRDAQIVGDGKYVRIAFASNKNYMDVQGDVQTITNFFNALVSQNLKEAFETAQSLKKGDWVYLKGEDSTESFDTPEGYRKQASTIFAYKVVLKSAKAQEPQPA